MKKICLGFFCFLLSLCLIYQYAVADELDRVLDSAHKNIRKSLHYEERICFDAWAKTNFLGYPLCTKLGKNEEPNGAGCFYKIFGISDFIDDPCERFDIRQKDEPKIKTTCNRPLTQEGKDEAGQSSTARFGTTIKTIDDNGNDYLIRKEANIDRTDRKRFEGSEAEQGTPVWWREIVCIDSSDKPPFPITEIGKTRDKNPIDQAEIVDWVWGESSKQDRKQNEEVTRVGLYYFEKWVVITPPLEVTTPAVKVIDSWKKKK